MLKADSHLLETRRPLHVRMLMSTTIYLLISGVFAASAWNLFLLLLNECLVVVGEKKTITVYIVFHYLDLQCQSL